MTLKKTLIASLAMAALAVPVMSGAVVTLSASPVLAKGGNGKGGSNRDSRGKSDRRKGGKGRAGQGSPARGNSGNGNGSGNGKPSKSAVHSAAEPVRSGEPDLHPSQLGSMNGALNANINAVLAHIRNGNINGPVGALAGLAVADHNADGAQTVLDRAAGFDALETALRDAGYETFEAYRAAVDAGDIDPVQSIEDASALVGDLADGEPPTEAEIADAEAALAALTDAEAHIYDSWNKSGAATEEEKDALLAALRDRLSGDGSAIADAIDTTDTQDTAGTDDDPDGDDEAVADDDGDDDGDDLDPDVQAIVDNLKF